MKKEKMLNETKAVKELENKESVEEIRIKKIEIDIEIEIGIEIELVYKIKSIFSIH